MGLFKKPFFFVWYLFRFFRRFRFSEEGRKMVGIEVEAYLCTQDEKEALPFAREFLQVIDCDRWAKELAACQVELRTRPHNEIDPLIEEFKRLKNEGVEVASKLGMGFSDQSPWRGKILEKAYPSERYERIKEEELTPDQFRAAIRLNGLHVHLGVGSFDEALQVYNRLVESLPDLMGVGTSEYRKELFNELCEDKLDPPKYKNIFSILGHALWSGWFWGFDDNWAWIRISPDLETVEVRVFDATLKPEKVRELVNLVLRKAWG